MGRVRRPNLLTTAVSSRRASPTAPSLPAPPATAATLRKETAPTARLLPTPSSAVDPTFNFKLYGVSPIWGNKHRDLVKHVRGLSEEEPVPLTWLPHSMVEPLGLTIKNPDTPRVGSRWGDLISGDATSDPSLLCYEAFRARRIPLDLIGTVVSPVTRRQLQKLLADAPSEFSSLYWGLAAEFFVAGAKILPGAHAVKLDPHLNKGKQITLFNAGQTSKPDFFTPETCVAYTPILVPEMRYEPLALASYWDVVLNREKSRISDEWISKEFVTSRGLCLLSTARCIRGRYNKYDFKEMQAVNELCTSLRRQRKSDV